MNQNSNPFARRVEEAALNAWPALRQVLYDGWLLRFAEGYTKRSNSVNMIGSSILKPEDKITRCEGFYTALKCPPLFRIATVHDYAELDDCLAAAGYRKLEPTLVMALDMRHFRMQPVRATSDFNDQVADIWLKHYYDLGRFGKDHYNTHNQILKSIVPRKLFAELNYKGRPVSMGMAVTEGWLTGLFDILTGGEFRRSGFGFELVTGLLQWAQVNGAQWAYLQVIESNIPAIQLYQKLGFNVMYHYWYRIKSDVTL